jgi:hypothetical protein
VRRQGHGGEPDRIAVGVAGLAEWGHGHGGGGRRCRAHQAGRWRLVLPADGDSHLADGAAAALVGHGVGEAVRADEARGRGIGHAGIVVDCDRTMIRQGERRETQRIAVRVAVVGQQLDPYRRVVLGRGEIGLGDRRQIPVGHGHGDGGGGHRAMRVHDAVAEAVDADEARLRPVGQGLVRQDLDAAVPGRADGSERQRIAVRVAVVGERQQGRLDLRHHGVAVVDGDRAAVDQHAHGTLGGAAGTVGDHVGEAVDAGMVGGGEIGHRLIGIDDGAAEGGRADADHHCAIGLVIVGGSVGDGCAGGGDDVVGVCGGQGRPSARNQAGLSRTCLP